MQIAGTKLDRYEIHSKIGAGGMGEVYLAEDTRLHRKVALKILPADVASNRDRMRRFEQEATAAAALNHPNIGHIYEIGEADGVHFIAMEFIDGLTLREVIHRGQTNLPKLLRYLQHTAEGLAKAHAAGIVHRDLKPDNIMITGDGHAKILDFGLAKLLEPLDQSKDRDGLRESLSAMPTAILAQHSQPGLVLGTAGYMSPEQAQGRVDEIDHRSDIFSFGCILFEAVTRRRAFEGKDALDRLHNIVHAPTPQIRDLNPAAPDDLQKIVRRCLAKDRDERYQSIKDVAIELKDVRRELAEDAAIQTTVPPSISTGTSPSVEAVPTQTPTPGSLSTRPSSAEYIISGITTHRRTAALIFGGLVVVAAAIGYGLYRFISPKQTPVSFQSAKFTRLTTTGNATAGAISPDGKWLVHVMDDGMQQSLWLRQVAIANSNTQIVPPAEVRYGGIAFSPDGNYVYYTVRENNSEAGTLYQMPVLGGTSRKVLTGITSSVTFSADGRRMAYFGFQGNEHRLMIANADGTGERQLAGRHGDEFFYAGGFSCVSWSPDGKTLASPIGSNTENYMSVVTVSVDSGEIKYFTSQKWQTVAQVAWFASGDRLLVTAQEPGSNPFAFGIWQLSYPAGEAQKITNDLNSYRNISLTSDGNLLTAVQIQVDGNVWVMPAFDEARMTQITRGTNLNGMPSWTPDNKLVYMSNASGSHDLYLMDPNGGNPKQLTANSRGNVFPSVSLAGRYIVFESTRTGVPHIWRMDINGENPKQLTNGFDSNPSISPDGQWLVYVNNANKDTVWRVAIDGGQPVQLTDKSSHMPTISPDGKQVACEYEEPNSPSQLAILPSEGGRPIKTLPLPSGFMPTNLRWTRDGREIVYGVTRGGVTNLWAQPVDGSPSKQLTNFTSDRIFFFDFSRDGKQVALSRGTLTRDVVLISNFK